MQRLGRAGPSRIFHATSRTAATAAAVRPTRVSSRLPPSSSLSSPASLPPRPPPPSSYDLAQRVIAAAEKGDIDRAIYIVKHSALDSQSTSVWNTLLKQILLAGRFRLSYEVFTDVCTVIIFIQIRRTLIRKVDEAPRMQAEFAHVPYASLRVRAGHFLPIRRSIHISRA